MNQAFRLGEDIALRGEILLNQAAHAELAGTPWSCEPRTGHYALMS